MARPRKEGMDYFPHDTDAANDEKIEALRSLYGNDGYAFYFIMLERIYRTPDFEIDVSDAETREQTFHILARKISVTMEQFEKMLSTALKWGCFDKEMYEEKGVITSEGIKKRASVVVEKREKMRLKRRSDNDLVSDAETREQTGVQMPQSKVKESKEKKSKEKKSSIYTEPDFAADDDPILNPENPFTFYQNNFGAMNPFLTEEMKDWCSTLGDELVTEAMKRAISQNKRTWSYTTGILKGWITKGIKTLEQAKAEQAEFERQKQQSPNGRKMFEDKLPKSVQWQMEQKDPSKQHPMETKSIADIPDLQARLLALRQTNRNGPNSHETEKSDTQ